MSITTKDLESQVEALLQEILTQRTQLILTQMTVVKLEAEIKELRAMITDIMLSNDKMVV